MALSGLHSGLNKGILQGIKTGLGMSNTRSGMLSGLTNGHATKDKIQNPTLLTGLKKPLIFCNADNLTINTGTQIALKDLAGSGYDLRQTGGTNLTPDLIENDIFGTRDSLNFNNGQCALYPNPSLSFNGKSSISVIMVVKLKSTAGMQVLYVDDNTTPGGIDLSIIDTNRTLRSIYYGGQPGTITNSQYDSFLSQGESQDWIILTCKYRLNNSLGAGSEQEMYVNSRFQHKLNSSNFNVVTTAYTSAQSIIVGNTVIAGGTRGNGMYLGSFLLLDYWLNESEQLRLENYFRWYYGSKF